MDERKWWIIVWIDPTYGKLCQRKEADTVQRDYFIEILKSQGVTDVIYNFE